MAVKDEVGRRGEQVAVEHLLGLDWLVLERNWRSARRDAPGELDIVARDGPALVFCEVKTRTGTGFGAPVGAVTWAKQRQVRRLSSIWLVEHQLRASVIRFDVIGILRGPRGYTVEHLRGVF